MSPAERDRRVQALATVLPFFRLCMDDELVGLILSETESIPSDEFGRRIVHVRRHGDHAGNIIVQLLAEVPRG